MKKLTLILLTLVMIVTLAACGSKCEHTYDNECDATCKECGEEREVSAHQWKAADCASPKTCKRCGATEGEALAHDWNEATCVTVKTCKTCGATEGAALGHRWTTPDVDLCEVQSTCSRCGATDGENKEHKPAEDDGDCTTEIKCTVCGDVTTPAAQHTPNEDDGDCTTAIACSVCGTVTTEAKAAHTPNEDDGDCTTDLTCTECEYVFAVGKNHDFNQMWNATHVTHWHVCLNDGCDVKDGLGEHIPEEDDGDCTTAVLCDECGWLLVSANESHTPEEDDGDCTTAIKCISCDTVTTEAESAHTPEEDDGDCTTEIKCSVCDSVSVEGRESHEDENLDGVCDSCPYEFDCYYDQVSDTCYIFTLDGLYAWSDDHYGNTNATLMNNIYMPEELTYDLDGDGEMDSNWSPVGFLKSFDGNGYSISGIKLNNPEGRFVGFFSTLYESGIVKNLSLIDVSVNAYLRVAGLVGSNSGTVINCSVSGNVCSFANDAAGIAGYNDGVIIACYNSADVYTEVGCTGGIVGQLSSNDCIVVGCYNTGTMTSNGSDNGGIIGAGYSGNVIACFAMGEVSGSSGLGALVGYDDSDCYLTECYFISESEDLKGVGNVSDDTVFRIDGTMLTLTDAIAAMNEALAERGYNWQYVKNEGSDADVRPIVIVEAEML